MGWQFAGFFAQVEAPALEAALRAWPGCRGRLITRPFQGIGVAVSSRALTYGDSDEEQEQTQKLAWAIEQELVEWSRRYPATPFVFIRADCLGGTCFYEGYVCEDGAILFQARDPHEGEGGALPRLVQALGVELATPPFFEPLSRSFFDRAN